MPEFRILGPLEVVEHDEPLVLGGPKQQAVLAVLLLHRSQVVSTDRLIDELWAHGTPATAAKTVQGYVSSLRKVLGADAVLTRGRGYVLSVASGQLDVDRFEQLAEEGTAALADGDAPTASDRLREALAVWRGPVLPEFAYERFAQGEIARLEEARLAALEDRIDADMALGRHDRLVPELELLVRDHPLRERLCGQRMLALYQTGRQADSLQAYRDTRRILIDKLGIEPGPELRQLHQSIVEQDPRLDPGARTPMLPQHGDVAARAAFVGREPELAGLDDALQDSVAGRGRLVLLTGEPGIGKSRLAEELSRHARTRGAQVLVGRCWEAGGAPAFWPWVQPLRAYIRATDPESLVRELGSDASEIAPILPELYELIPGLPRPTAPESDGARFRLFHAVAEFLRRASENRPLVLVLDDLHAADTPSLLLVQFLARELGSMHLLLLAAMRDVDPIPGEPLTAMLVEVTREPVTRRVSLKGLTEPAVRKYVELTASELASHELVSALYAETEGNPLFVSETVRLLALEGAEGQGDGRAGIAIPQSVRDVISRRLARLPTTCRHTLELASVLGREFSLDTLALVTDDPEERVLRTLDEALAARVISEVPGSAARLRFAHVLIRDTLYAGLTITRRVQVHRRARRAIETRLADKKGPHLAELAHHAIAGSDFEDAREYAARAGDWAMSLLAYEEAERLYASALEALDLAAPSDDRGRCELLLSLGEARAWAGNTTAAQASFLEAADLARQAGLDRELARAVVGYGGRIVWARAGKDARLIPLLESGLAALSKNDVELRVRLLARLAGALRDEPSPERRDALTREAVELARRTDDPGVLACALDGRGSVIGDRPGGKPEQVDLATELRDVAERAGDRERVGSAHYQLFLAAIGLGNPSDAEANLTAATNIAEELRHPSQLWHVRAARAMVVLATGMLPEAEELIKETRALGERAHRGTAIPTHALQLYTLRDLQGRLAEVEPTIRAAAGEYPSQPVFRCVLTHLYARLSREAEALRLLDKLAADNFSALPVNNEWLYGASLLAEACSILHDAPTATGLYRQLIPYREYNAVDTPDAILGSVSRYLGLLAAIMHRWKDAVTHFDDAITMNAEMGFLPWLAHTQRDYARTLLEHGEPADREQAVELTRAALANYTTLGMDSWGCIASKLDDALRAPEQKA